MQWIYLVSLSLEVGEGWGGLTEVAMLLVISFQIKGLEFTLCEKGFCFTNN